MPVALSTIATAYERDGFVFPYDVLSPGEAKAIRTDLESAEAELAERLAELTLLRAYPDRLLPSFDALIRHPRLIEAVSQILGPDLMVWSGGLYLKEAHTPSYVSWHQDLTYWGLSDVQEITAWVALSPATIASGCMRFVPGSHKQRMVPHVDSFADDNLLSRGQEIAVDVAESDAVDVILQPGQASLHHGHLFHASGPNQTDDRRIGVAIRYITPSMQQKSGDRSLVAHVSGEDRHGHFMVAGPPSGDLVACGLGFELGQHQLIARGPRTDHMNGTFPVSTLQRAPNRFAVQGNDLLAKLCQSIHPGDKRLMQAFRVEQRKDTAKRVVRRNAIWSL